VKFKTEDDVISAVRTWLHEQGKEWFRQGKQEQGKEWYRQGKQEQGTEWYRQGTQTLVSR
jgi:hypothetical protein